MSNDLHDLFKKELEQIPLRPAETWVPQRRRGSVLPNRASRGPLAIMAAVVVVVAALIGGRQLATFRNQSAATPGVIAGKALYVSPSFNGSGWIQVDPESLKDLSSKPLLDIAPSTTNSAQAEVSTDGSTIIVNEFNGSRATRKVYDARTGQLRGYFVPEVAMALDALSADGSLALGRVGDNRTPVDGEKVIVSVPDGHVVRRVPATSLVGVVQGRPVAADLSAIYYVVTPTEVSLTSTIPQSLPYALVVQSTLTGALSLPVPLPGITAGTVYAGPLSASTTLTVRPGLAITPDGNRLAALSADGRSLDVVDLRTLAVTSVTVHKRTSFIDLFRPLVADAKTLNDQEQQAMAFTPDGTAVISWVTQIQYDDTNGPTRTTHGIQRIDLATGLVTAESSTADGIYGFTMSPDGQSVYLIVRAHEPPNPLYVLRRLDAQTLGLKAERSLPNYAELQVLAAPAPAAASATPTPPTRTQPPVGCPRARLEYLVEGFFTMYNAHHSADLSNLFKTQLPDAAGGFSDYFDDPGVPMHFSNVGKLLAYWDQRFAVGDHFDTHTVIYPPDGAAFPGNPTATFSRSFTGGTQQGNVQFDCNDGLLVAVRMSSDYPGWEWRDAFSAQFSVPAAWHGPTDIDTQKGAGAPKNWLVFTDATGSTQVSVWLVDDTAEHFATTRLQGDRRTSTISDAGQTRDVIEVHAPATWSGPTGAGSYDNRHLVVQVTPTLAADVFVSAPRINGPSSVTPEQIQLLDRITVRISGGTDLAAAQTHDVDGYTFTAQLLFDRAYGMTAADPGHAGGLEGVGLTCTWSRTGNDLPNAQFLFGPAAAPVELSGYTNVTRGTTGNRTGGFPVAASADTGETHAVCLVRDPSGDHGVEVVVQFTRQAGITVVSTLNVVPWRR
jgi:hypothetical protein